MLLAGYALGRWPGVHISQHISVVKKKFWSLVIPTNIRSTGREFYIWTSSLRISLRCQFSLSCKDNGVIGEWCCLKFLYTLSLFGQGRGSCKADRLWPCKEITRWGGDAQVCFCVLAAYLSNSINILVKHSFSYPKVSQHSAGYFEICLPWKFSEIWPRWWAAGLTILRRIRVNSKVNFSTRNWMKKLKLTLNWDVQVHSIMI